MMSSAFCGPHFFFKIKNSIWTAISTISATYNSDFAIANLLYECKELDVMRGDQNGVSLTQLTWRKLASARADRAIYQKREQNGWVTFQDPLEEKLDPFNTKTNAILDPIDEEVRASCAQKKPEEREKITEALIKKQIEKKRFAKIMEDFRELHKQIFDNFVYGVVCILGTSQLPLHCFLQMAPSLEKNHLFHLKLKKVFFLSGYR
jgi:hypothetical protein